jgi:hypothetical protein
LTDNVDKHYKILSRAAPANIGLSIVAIIEGDEEKEAEIHSQFRQERMADSKWFSLSPKLNEYIAGLARINV